MKKRILPIMLTLIIIFSSYMSITAFAESTNSQDGIVATLSVDKESYDLDEEIDVNLTVENTNTYDVKNVTTEIILPSGVSVTSGTTLQESVTLLAGESVTNEITVIKENSYTDDTPSTEDTPSTGDTSIAYLWAIVAVGSIAGLIFISIKNKKLKNIKFLVLILALSIFYTNSPMIASASTTDNVTTKSFTVSETILIDGEENIVEAKITYDYTETDEDDTVTLSFNAGEGSEVSSVTIEKGTALGYVPYTVLDGAVFDNWYTDISFTETFNPEDTINEDTTIYAKFQEDEIEYTEFESTEMALLDQATTFSFTVYSEEKITSSNLSSYVQITEVFGSSSVTGIDVKYIVTSSGNNYTITADGGYDEGSMYEVVFLEGVTLISPTKDGYNLDVITTLTYSIYKEEVEIVEYKEDATFFEIDESLLSITNTDEELVMGYASATSENLETIFNSILIDNKTEIEVDDIIILQNGDDVSQYGAIKVTSVDYDENGNCSFSYIGCEYDDIYSSVDIYTSEEFSVSDMLADLDTVAMAKEIKESEGVAELTYMLAVALSQNETVTSLGDGTQAFTIDMDALVEAENSISSMSTSDTLSENVYFNNTSENQIITLDKLYDGLTVTVTIGQMQNDNFVDFNDISDECFGIQVEVNYAVKLDNGVYIDATIDITESFVGRLYSQSESYDESSADFHYYVWLESETDIGFEILVCSAEFSDDTEENPDTPESSSDFDASADEVPDISEYVDISKEIASTISEALTDDELEEENDNIVARMLALLENEGDSIELFNAPIATGSFNVAYVFDINIYFNFVVSIDFAAGLQTEFSYITSQKFGVVGSTRTQDIEFYSEEMRPAGYSFDLYACGYIGLKAGMQSEISVSMAFLKNVGEVGAGFEFGAYIDIYGYLHYNYVKQYYSGGTSQSLSGGIYMEMGLYIESYIFARSNLFEAEGEWSIVEIKIPFLSVGNQYVYLELADETHNAELSYGVLTGEYTSIYDILPTYYGEYLDITSGDIVVMPIEQSNRFGVYETTDIPYIRTTYVCDENGDWIPNIIFDQDEFNLYSNYYEVYGELRLTDYFDTSITYEDYYIGSSGDLYAEDIGLTITYCGDQLSTTLSTFRDAGDVECIWVADGFDASNVGKAYTATFQFETTDGELITLGTRTSVAGTQTGYFDIYANASDELIQQYALDEVYKFYDDGMGTYLSDYCTWDIDPTDNYMTEDTTYTVTAEERQSYIAYVYLDNGVYTYDVLAVTNGEIPDINVEDGSFYTVESVSLYNTSDYTTIYDIDYNNLSAVYTDVSIDPQNYIVGQTGFSVSDESWTKSDAINQAKLFLGYYNDANLVYIANYDVDDYTVTYVTNSTVTHTEELGYNEAPSYGSYYAYSVKSYQTFAGWDADGDGEVDYTIDEDGNCNLPCTNKDVTYTAVYETCTYTIYIEDYLGNQYEYEVEYMADIPEEVTTILQQYALEDNAELDSGIAKDFMWAYSYGDNEYKYYFAEDEIDDTMSNFTGTYTTYYDSLSITPYYQTFYEMTVSSGEVAFDETELANAIDTIETSYSYEYRDVTIIDDYTVSMYVLKDYAMQPSLFYLALVEPTIDDELSYYYDIPYWQDQDENEYSIGDITVYSQENMTFTAVYEKVEIEYSAKVYSKTDGVINYVAVDSFEGIYNDYQDFVNDWYAYEKEPTITDETITTYTGYYTNMGATSIDIYLEYSTEAREYTVTFSDDIGELENKEDVDYGTDITVESQENVETADYTYVFKGWEIGDTLYEVGDSFTVTGDITATAVWEQTCTITFAYSEESSTAYKTYTGVVGEEFYMTEVPDYVMSGDIYEFTGWSAYPTEFTKNMTITVEYDYIDYTVTFELDTNGTVETTTKTAHYGDNLAELLETPTDASVKIWSGWGIENVGTTDFDNYTITDNVTVTGTLTSVYITYMTGTTQYSKTAIDIGETVTVKDTIIGYGEWEVSGATLNNDEAFTMPSQDVTISAYQNLDGTFTISNENDTNIYDTNTFEASIDNVSEDELGYEFDTENGILWINSDDLILSGEAVDLTIIVDYEVKTLTLKDLTVQNLTQRDYEFEEFPWISGEGVEVDPINAFILYAYGLDFTLTIDGDVNLTQQNIATGGDQYIILYLPLTQGTYEYYDEITEEPIEADGWVYTQGTFVMQGANEASFTCDACCIGISASGATEISDIDFDINAMYDGIIIYSNWDSEYNSYGDGTLNMTNCIISGSTTMGENGYGNYVIIAFEKITFIDCEFIDNVKDYISSVNSTVEYIDTTE
ncbi:MAG: hypothetical protein R3Y35_04320 [Clostridia bacterium]